MSLLPSFAALSGVMISDVMPLIVSAPIIFILGGCFGSFANAAAMRLVRDESPIAPPSRCRFCDKPLGWRENMPLFGWLFLRGRCGCAAYALPLRYVAVEWGFACLTLWLAFVLPVGVFAALTLLNIIMVIALLTDTEAMVLHPPSLLGGIVIALAASFTVPAWPISMTDSAIGAAVGAAIIIIVNALYHFTRGKRGLGQGDIWLLAMIGATYGPLSAVAVFFAASWLGALIGISLIMLKKAESGSKLPFGLFLSVVFLLYPALNMLLI